MECRRCGEDTLPGLVACVSCGLPAGAPAPTPVATVPRVRTANPLDRRVPRRPRGSAWGSFVGPLSRLGGGPLLAATLGLVPGLGPLRRGEGVVAGVFGGLLLLGLAAIGLTWTSAEQPLAIGLVVALAFASAFVEARRALPVPEPFRAVAATLLALTAVLAARTVSLVAFDAALRPVEVAGSPRLPAGTYLTRRVDTFRPGMVVAAEVRQRFDRFAGPLDTAVSIAPVLAVAGQRVESRDGELFVDGAPSAVLPLAPNPRVPTLPAPLVVPSGTVMLYLPELDPVPIRAVRGEIVYRWWPAEQRGWLPAAGGS